MFPKVKSPMEATYSLPSMELDQEEDYVGPSLSNKFKPASSRAF